VARLSPLRLAGGGLLLLAIVAVALWRIPSDRYLLIPDPAHPVAPLVQIEGRKPIADRAGGIYFVDVFEKRASMLESLIPGIHEGSSLVSAKQVLPPCGGEKLAHQAAVREMVRSQKIAAAVALRQLGYRVPSRPTGVMVSQVFADSHAVCKLQPTDVIVSADGKPIRTIAQLRTALSTVRPGQLVRLGVRRGDRLLRVAVKTVAAPGDPTRAIVGFSPDQSTSIQLPIRVSIDARGVGGPSAGLAFALEVMEQLGRDVDHGRRVAATGEIGPDGRVTPIGGVKQKTFGARNAKVDVFLVPAGENAREARRYANGLRIVPVRSFQQALHALATLGPVQ
jgi:PDZ domain-containing protein